MRKLALAAAAFMTAVTPIAAATPALAQYGDRDRDRDDWRDRDRGDRRDGDRWERDDRRDHRRHNRRERWERRQHNGY
jgi:hypothetical protein